MNTQDKLNVGIGTESAPRLLPREVTIVDVSVEEKMWGSKKSDALVIMVKHPDRIDPVRIYNIAFLKNDTNIKSVGLTISYDSEGQIMKDSGIAQLLLATNSETLADLKGKTVNTMLNKEGYLSLKVF